ncbi:MAG TPA: general secretion pathway protein GspE [Cyanothece sp. UBA12306]|nr:general secretion pathway protein GspE [Cyanothece sp. UBA12306]
MSLSNELDQFARSPLTNQLIQSGYVSLPRMQQALIESKKTGRPIIEILEQITGNPLPPTLLQQYKDHNLFTLKILHGIEFINQETESLDGEQITKLINEIIPFEVCRRYQVLPLKQLEQSAQKVPLLLIGMVNPSHSEAQEVIKRLLISHNISWQRMGISQEDYDGLIEKYTPPQRKSKEQYLSSEVTLVSGTEVLEEAPQATANFFQTETSSPVVTLVNKILVTAIEKQGIEIELESQKNNLIVLYRQRNSKNFQPLFEPLPKKVAAPIISRLKIMAQLDISQQKTPQKGLIVKQGEQRILHLYVHTLPSVHGEKVSIRIVDSTFKPLTLETLISNSSVVQSVQTMTHHSSGLLLVSSANREELANLLYALVSDKNPQQLKIGTVEESISYMLPGVSQIELDLDGEKDYACVLRSLLQQDLDILMVDHLTEPTMARMVVEMSKNCLILTSLSANDGASALAHLSQMVDQSLLAQTLIGIIHQYTVPRLCPTCSSVYDPHPDQLAKFGISEPKKSEISFYKPRKLSNEAREKAKEKGRLCRQCNGKGYQGQREVYEIFPGTPSLKTAIAQGADRKAFKEAARVGNSVSPLSEALELVAQSQVSLGDLEAIFSDYLMPLSSAEPIQDVSVDLSQRLANFEKLLVALTNEFQQIKQALEQTPSSSPDLNAVVTNLDQTIIKTPNTEEFNEEDFDQEIDLSKETITADSPLYEELTDPGEWEELKRELQPGQKTHDIDVPDFDDSKESEEFNPFNSIPDPWS